MAFLVFIVVPTGVMGVVLAVTMCVGLVWTDLLHVNPDRSTGNVVAMMLLSPVYAVFGTVVLAGWPILAGAVLASLAVLSSGRLSSGGTTAVAVVCTAMFIHGCYQGAAESATELDWQQTSPPWSTLVGGSLLLTAALFGGRSAFQRATAGLSSGPG